MVHALHDIIQLSLTFAQKMLSNSVCCHLRSLHFSTVVISSVIAVHWQLESQTCGQNAEVFRRSLWKAVDTGDLETVVELHPGSDVLNYCNKHEPYLLFQAVLKARSTEMIRYLIHQGANIHVRDHRGSGVMHIWARATAHSKNIEEIGKLLVDLHADVNAQRYVDGMTPLHHLAAGYNRRRGKLDLRKAFFLRHHRASLSLRSMSGKSPVDLIESQAAQEKFIGWDADRMRALLLQSIPAAAPCENCFPCWPQHACRTSKQFPQGELSISDNTFLAFSSEHVVYNGCVPMWLLLRGS